MSTLKLANEAYKLTLAYGAEKPIAPSELVAARGDTAAFQLILCSDDPYSVSIDGTEWYSHRAWSNLRRPHRRLRVSVESPFESSLGIEEFVTDDDGKRKADIILAQSTRDSEPGIPSAVWAQLWIPEDAEPGKYNIKVTLYSSLYAENEKIECEYRLPLTVYSHIMKNPRDRRFYLDLWQHNSNVARHYDVKLWSDEHFAVIENVVRSLAALGQKSVTVCVSEIPWSGQGCTLNKPHGGNMFEYSIVGITKSRAGKYVYDYSKMQRYIDLCTRLGMSGDIEVFGLVNLWSKPEYSLGTPDIDHVEPIRLRYLDLADGLLKYVRDHEVVKDYVRSLEHYFVKSGQIDRVRIAADEPSDMEKYRRSISLMRNIAPAFRYKTAINHPEFIDEFGDVIDDFVPYLGCACEKFGILKEYQKKLAGKRFLWYVCCGGGRPNTQLRQHLTEARMIGPMNYRFGFDGFLRWAYTIWPEDPRSDLRYSSFECGDTALVYPAYNGDVLLSLRYKSLDRGIADYELLLDLEEAGEGELAEKLVANLMEETDLGKYFERSEHELKGAFTHDWEDFNSLKKAALERLSK